MRRAGTAACGSRAECTEFAGPAAQASTCWGFVGTTAGTWNPDPPFDHLFAVLERDKRGPRYSRENFYGAHR